MAIIKCQLISHSISPHVQQLYTGFSMLHIQGKIDLSQKIIKKNNAYRPNKAQYLRNATHAHLKVEMSHNNKTRTLYFDNHDAKEIDQEHLNNCDYYFKRSYSGEYIKTNHSENASKIFPLGLNYLVYPDHFDKFAIGRDLKLGSSFRNKIDRLKYTLDLKRKNKFIPKLKYIQAQPDYSLDPKVLFLVTAYDPYDVVDRPKEKIEEIIHNNELRAESIRILRKELGKKFYGGFNHNNYTKKYLKDVLVDDNNVTSKQNYLNLLKSFTICIATTGLHSSIGWKFAEYISFSKAIISENLYYEVPGNLEPDKNYLVFNSTEELINKAHYLLNNENYRNEMMQNNYNYYQNYVQPDILVLNVLKTALNNTL